MANISKIKAQGSIYDIEDTVARTSVVAVTSKADGTVELTSRNSTVTLPSLTNFGDPSELENDVVTEISDLKSQIALNSGVPASVKNAIKTLLFSANYNDLDLTDEKAIIADWVSVHMISISATFAQGSETIYDTDSLNYLKPFLSVTARYDDGTSGTIADYTLSGELIEGTSTITVTKDELTATFNVSVTASPLPEGYTLYDYVTANGTQYIQTDITEAQAVDWGYECKESANGTAQGNGHILSSTNVYFPFLGRGNAATDLWSVSKRYGNDSSTLISGTTTSYEVGSPYTFKAFLDGTDYINRLDANGEFEYTAVLTKGSTGLTSSNKFALFTYGGGVTTTKYRFKGNFYYLKLTDVNGNLVHHYIPCRNANNVIGLYDVVAESFLSPTAGTFTGKAR